MARSNTLKLPKKIAGVKVPKFLRQPGTIAEFLNSPVGRAVLAEARPSRQTTRARVPPALPLAACARNRASCGLPLLGILHDGHPQPSTPAAPTCRPSLKAPYAALHKDCLPFDKRLLF